MVASEEVRSLVVTFVSRGLGFSSNKSYMVSHIEVPPSLLHVVSVNKGVIFYFSNATALPFFAITPKVSFCGFSLKMEKNNSYWIYRDKNEHKLG